MEVLQKSVFLAIQEIYAPVPICTLFPSNRRKIKKGGLETAHPSLLRFDHMAEVVYKRLNRGYLFHYLDASVTLVPFDDAILGSEERIVASHLDVVARTILGTLLSHEDVARPDLLAGEALHAEMLRIAVATIPACSLSFFM